MKILTREQIGTNLYEYYKTNYGEKETDVWYEQPATNVWVFGRDNKVISLICHILNGKVTEKIEELNK